MAIMDPNAEQDVVKVYQLVVELSDQLTQTKQVVSSLYAESQKLKVGETFELLLIPISFFTVVPSHTQ